MGEERFLLLFTLPFPLLCYYINFSSWSTGVGVLYMYGGDACGAQRKQYGAIDSTVQYSTQGYDDCNYIVCTDVHIIYFYLG
jgi:hypothetical protein